MLHLAIAVFGQRLQICSDNQQKEEPHPQVLSSPLWIDPFNPDNNSMK